MQHAETLRSTLPLVLFAILAGSAAWACFGDRGIMTNRALLAEVDARVERLQERRANIEFLRAEIQAMKDDPVVQERWIRQELGYVRPGELLVLFPGEREPAFAAREARP